MKRRLTIILTLFFTTHFAFGQKIPYGDNKETGKYFKVEDAKIYYETYGTGEPLILLHGGLFGDISEFEKLIPRLSEHYRVIAIDLRGHGKSEIGDRPFTYDILAKDVYEILKSITKENAIVIGFSDGAITALKFAVTYPNLVKRLVCLGGPILSPMDYKPGMIENLKTWTGDLFEKEMPDFVKERKALMPQPDRWNDFVEKLKYAWTQPIYVEKSEIEKLKSPLLMICGDRDQYISLESYTNVFRQFRNAQISIIPNSSHVVLLTRPDLVENNIMTFLTN